MNVYNHHYNDLKISNLEKINKVNHLIAKHEEVIANPILNFISNNDKFNLIGKNKITNKNRAPTISFTVNNMKSSEVSNILVSNKIATRNDNFYAWRCLSPLNRYR